MNEWISVEDRYPNSWQTILIWRLGEMPQIAIFDGAYNHHGFTHWMPLPELPSHLWIENQPDLFEEK